MKTTTLNPEQTEKLLRDILFICEFQEEKNGDMSIVITTKNIDKVDRAHAILQQFCDARKLLLYPGMGLTYSWGQSLDLFINTHQNWISVTDKLPEEQKDDHTWYLVYRKFYPYKTVATYYNKQWHYGTAILDGVTHWMVAPEDPNTP